jgi:hypothetical protein
MSHAVGCAFAACLERKQRREKECGVTASFDASRTSFVREGSFRVTSSSQQGVERDDIMKQLQDKKKGMSHPEMKSSTDTQRETSVTHILMYHWKVTGKSNAACVIEQTGGFTHCGSSLLFTSITLKCNNTYTICWQVVTFIVVHH